MSAAGIFFKDLVGLAQLVHPEDSMLLSFESFQEKIANADYLSVLSIRCVGPTGTIVWLEDHFFSIQYDSDGNPERLMSYTVNVTS